MADDLLIQLALTMDGELGREERRARARAALRAQYVAGLEAAIAVCRGNIINGQIRAGACIEAICVLAEQAKREGTTP